MRFAPRRHVGSLAALEDASRDALAALLVDALGRFDHLWNEDDELWNEEKRFPYLLWFHQAPAAGGDEYHVHAHVAPPLRAPGVARYVASGELGSGTLANPVVPEDAARALRDAR
jgi:UDPglucose--hexose-1-phosphate uridylyltransferase